MGGHRALFVARSESREERRAWRRNAAAQAELRACIEKVLRQVYDKHEEVSRWWCIVRCIGAGSSGLGREESSEDCAVEVFPAACFGLILG